MLGVSAGGCQMLELYFDLLTCGASWAPYLVVNQGSVVSAVTLQAVLYGRGQPPADPGDRSSLILWIPWEY